MQAGYIHATIEIAKVMVIEGWPLEEAERLFNVPAIVDEKQPAAPSSPSRRGSDRSTRRRRTSGCSQDGDVLLLGLLQNRLQVGMERDGELGSGLCRTTLIFPPGGVP